MAEFTKVFNVEKGSGAYRNFIEDLHVELGETFSHNIPVLPAQQNPPTRCFLGYDGGYNALERVSGQGMNNIALGPTALTNAVNDLATSTISYADRMRSLIIVIQMFCKSITFTRISNLLAVTFSSSSSSSFPNWMLALVRSYGDLFAALLRADVDPNNFFRLLQPNDMNIVSALDAVTVLDILLKSVRASSSSNPKPQTVSLNPKVLGFRVLGLGG
ncbi:ribosome-inactivating protein charybdin-like [Camellia sinensis]|uniref:ribosome-inactivating protein charybdin-like n=1 Tax=Camellia sinensis TaxID=4442 RepID=UPI0010358892|nr:ribosome-inactivating protein charybdin-like [Camellia sinensis]